MGRLDRELLGCGNQPSGYYIMIAYDRAAYGVKLVYKTGNVVLWVVVVGWTGGGVKLLVG